MAFHVISHVADRKRFRVRAGRTGAGGNGSGGGGASAMDRESQRLRSRGRIAAADFREEYEEEEEAQVKSARVRAKRPKPASPSNHILFQGFNWESHSKKPWYVDLKEKAPVIAQAGVTDIWLPPPSQSVDRQGYLPSQLYDLNSSSYGNEAQLKELIDTLHEQGICCIADIVINHRSGWKQDAQGHWNIFEGGTPDKRLDWGPWAVVCNDIYRSGGQGKQDTGESYAAAPDLDHTNKQVQDELTDWLNWMKAEIGFDGWRFDFVKGYAPKYTKLYCQRTDPSFVVGELWTSLNYVSGRLAADQNFHRQQLCDWIDGTGGWGCAFDFTTKGVLQEAVKMELWRLRDKEGRPPGLVGWYPKKAVTFVDNHDTGSTQRHWHFPDEKVHLGYVYILTHPGIPCIFYDHYFYWGLQEQINQLLELRLRNKINAESKIKIQAADFDMYVATIADRLIVKLGPRFDMGPLLPKSSTWKLVMAGSEYAIWESTKKMAGVAPSEPEIIVVKSGPSETGDENIEVKITSDMSCETVNRIMEEVPDMVSNLHDVEKVVEECKVEYEDEGEDEEEDEEEEESSKKKLRK
ncbi:alpha-amylase [Selaginella moellendorffii]|uniref:alpha-amylase n=1 Tax=Selaginella moellendorffii TaxID=88036 RepID=UPI000D1C4E92|nr:alpha-amylase [Selaginella moellendorffii]|eukprot:XP_024544858.1 alpha-amylase [Selaginella moellendorffii]